MSAKILIVDDDSMIRDIYLRKFRESGFAVTVVADGPTAIQKIEEDPPDVVLLDLVMPQMDGFEVMREVAKRKLTKMPKLVLLTNLGQKEEIEQGLALGAQDYIIKAHLTPSEVVERVRTVLGGP
ncbi:response regulator [Candidatus Parcubacteria bacterium]|nr:response regulator [Candidatus Parcubacteria bacterium]MBI4099361.1 response regulator [Candidatus Parcubacteria bacterium]MBI4385517.1 response regulator [Candidatus Parcubacteria bacterium]